MSYEHLMAKTLLIMLFANLATKKLVLIFKNTLNTDYLF